MTKYVIQKKKEYHSQSTDIVTFSSSANVTVIGSLKDNVAALIPGAHTVKMIVLFTPFRMCVGENQG